MPVRKISTRKPIPDGSAQALVEEVRKRANKTGNRRGGVLVVFGDDAAHIYYEGDDPTPSSPVKRRKLRRSSAA
jgi:hypothetical protein